MDSNKISFLLGIVGAVITLTAYSQPFMSPTQAIGTGLVVLLTGLLIKEGLIPV